LQNSKLFNIQARLREAASLEKHVLLKKLRDALESLKGRVAGRNKDDVEEAISMVSCIFFLHFSIPPPIELIPDIKFLTFC
jgi:gamma-glutamyl phosphate reductase